MKRYALTQLPDDVLRREIKKDPAREGDVTAMALARLAEYDARKLYLPDGFPSMLAYCRGELWLSEDEAKKRIRVARTGRLCPGVFEALADGRVNLSGLVYLAAHLTPENSEELLAAASRKPRSEIERLIAERFPRADVAASVEAIPSAPLALATDEGAPGPPQGTVIPGQADANAAPGSTHGRGRVSPLSSEAYAVQFTRSREADERFRYAQDLLGHEVAPNDIAEVYDLAMKELVEKLERKRFAATMRPGRRRRTAAGSRHIPTHVKRAVWQRDEGRCTFVSDAGRRCEAKRALEFDHVKEFARGGDSTVDNIRLRCRGHNQYTAERTFGAGFMKEKRSHAKAAAVRPAKREHPEPEQEEDDVFRALRTLGYRAEESHRALALCQDIPDAPPGDRLRRALTYFPMRGRRGAPAASEGSGVALPE